ncbi:putative ankyrin repeat-containing domain, PGG domain, ankyrin repeat-containing domain superfamily [Helianthus annuus]|uniref:Ankyrin repeat-containing domain, PGG domain, ankyrin repeat-containing domain superfamily n=2 Tax=Helianthus annuus TaxID=4232 RepID=A0A9K3NCH6_HELAN|nr:putative ankyrin repeat-containing domain, PGG domain, ankyrin repeat-containing domain superfamily [Helianthus annuus]KAJ0901027.1 putative ankyrin repeat-containing domain, PGG domain, ankyrin repeat-containing domain superfamily [Helianthus annuus]
MRRPSSSEEVDGTSQSTFDPMKLFRAITDDLDPLPYLFDNRNDYFDLVVPLYEASVTGNWESAKFILDKRPDLVRYGLGSLGTALHVAATAKESKETLHFVKNLVNMMTGDELQLQNRNSNTAFWIACANGKINMAKIMMEKNSSVLHIRGNLRLYPLTVGVESGTRDLVKWLYNNFGKMNGDHWGDDDRDFVLYSCVIRGFFDIAIQILKDYPEYPLPRHVPDLLNVLAEKRNSFDKGEKKLITRIIEPIYRLFGMSLEEDTDALKVLEIIWKRATKTMDFKEIQSMLKVSRSSGILFDAARSGNTRFIVEVLRRYPDLMFEINEDGHTIFHIAVMHRNQGICNLLYEIGDGSRNNICRLTDKNKNNILHLVGKSSKEMATKMSGASLLMQRELLWFQEIRKMMPPFARERKNNDGQTPYELFSKENEEQVAKGLKWMKDCMVVATLIVTVAFAAAFTVPGGYKEENGLPFFIHQPTLLVFVIADAISLFSSSTSLLVFLSVLTTRHDQSDFMYSLPTKLVTGLLTLLISVAAMMLTFSASFYVLYHNGQNWVPILIAAFTAIPVIVFAVLQFPLLVDMFCSMYDSHYLFTPKKRMLYIRETRLCSNNARCW